jgi:hypothetical protein
MVAVARVRTIRQRCARWSRVLNAISLSRSITRHIDEEVIQRTNQPYPVGAPRRLPRFRTILATEYPQVHKKLQKCNTREEGLIGCMRTIF